MLRIAFRRSSVRVTINRGSHVSGGQFVRVLTSQILASEVDCPLQELWVSESQDEYRVSEVFLIDAVLPAPIL